MTMSAELETKTKQNAREHQSVDLFASIVLESKRSDS